MESHEYNGGLLGLQKREYLAYCKTTKEIRKGLYLILEPSVFGFKEAPSVAATEPS